MASSSSSSSSLALDFDVHLAASAGIESLHSLVHLFSHPSQTSSQQQQLALDTICHFKQVISLLSRPGHARVRRSPTCITPNPHQIYPNLPPPCSPLSQSLFGSKVSTTGSDDFDEEEEEEDDGASCVSFQRRKISSLIDLNNPLVSDNNPLISDNNNSNNNNSFSMSGSNLSSIDLNKQAPSSPSSQKLLCSSQTTLSEGSILANEPQKLLTNGYFRPPLVRPKASVGRNPVSKQGFIANDGGLMSNDGGFIANDGGLMSNDGGLTDQKSLNHDGGYTLIDDKGELAGPLTQAGSTNQHSNFGLNFSTVSTNISCITLEGSAPTNGSATPVKQQQPEDHNSSALKRKCANNPSKCHCSKRRKLKSKSVKIVPAISDKIAEIPPDDYSWRKYGQKPIKGSPYPRGYYKCSGLKGCPAKKHVERARDDPSMLIVTYEGEHIHSRLFSEETLQA